MPADLVDALLIVAGVAFACLVVWIVRRELRRPTCFDDIEG